MKTYSVTEVVMTAGHSIERKTLAFSVSLEKAERTRNRLEEKYLTADFDPNLPVVSYLIRPSCLS